LGDVKFVTAGVLWIGIEAVPALLTVAVLSAFISLVILRAEGHSLSGKQAISFGPHLAVALWLTWIAGPLQFTL
jgi:leader peptidase (prepilin peptidase)/N-methyltransferase